MTGPRKTGSISTRFSKQGQVGCASRSSVAGGERRHVPESTGIESRGQEGPASGEVQARGPLDKAENLYGCYLLVAEDRRKTYCGITTDLERRLLEHNGQRPGGA